MIDPAEQPDSRVTIERLNCVCLVPKDQPDPDRLGWRIDDLVRKQLGPICGQALSRALNQGDPSVWLIRQLDLDLAIDFGGLDDDPIGRAWGQRIAAQIARTIASGADGDRVLHFPDRAAYLAQFVGDLAGGGAWGKWYYTAFDSLRSLPDSMAIVEALIREPQYTDEVLQLLLQRSQLERVLSTIGDVGARLLYEASTLTSGSDADWRSLIDAIVSVWPEVPLRSPFASASNALRLLTALRARYSYLTTGAEVRQAIDHALRLAEALAHVPFPIAGDSDSAVGSPVNGGQASELTQLADWLFFQHVAAGDGRWLAQVVQTINPSAKHERLAEQSSAEVRTFVTPYGGLFLLLPVLLELGIAELIESAACPSLENDRIAAAPLLRFILALKCLGRARAREALWDAGVQWIVGLERHPALEVLQKLSEAATDEMNAACWQSLMLFEPADHELAYFSLQGLTPAIITNPQFDRTWSIIACTVLRRFAQRLIGFDRGSAEYLYQNFLCGNASVRLAPDEISVQLAASPLQMILRMAGFDGLSYRLPWLNGPPITVSLE